MDISGSARTGLDIFRLVIDGGPLTLYSASTQSRFSLGTIHRHLMEMERTEKISPYAVPSGGRKRKPYGPTVFGLTYYSRIDGRIRSRLGSYFLRWLDHADFQDDLARNGFDIGAMMRDPKKSEGLFCKYVGYCALIEDQIDGLRRDWNSVPRDVAVFIGEMLLLTNEPSHFKTWQSLYLQMPGLREHADLHIGNMLKLKAKLHRRIGS